MSSHKILIDFELLKDHRNRGKQESDVAKSSGPITNHQFLWSIQKSVLSRSNQY